MTTGESTDASASETADGTTTDSIEPTGGTTEEPTTGPGPITGTPVTSSSEPVSSSGEPGVCGDGSLDPGEACDDGNSDDSDECVAGCVMASCGDGFVGPGEACDDGNDVDDDECANDCSIASCGDGALQAGEQCDDGNGVDSDECLNSCVSASCGDLVVQDGVEQCDDGNDVATDECQSCVAAVCGDGVVQDLVEQCDDGNMVDVDGCSNACQLPTCTDKLQNNGESDVDCGGDDCVACPDGKACVDADDCGSGVCMGGKCGGVKLMPDECDPINVNAPVAYAAVVKPSCGCHTNGSGGLTISSAATLKSSTVNVKSSAGMNYVTPGNIDESYLLYKVHGQQLNVPGGKGSQMPLGGELDADDRCLLINWVQSGAN